MTTQHVKRGSDTQPQQTPVSASHCANCGMSKPAMDSARKVGVTWAKFDGACCEPEATL